MIGQGAFGRVYFGVNLDTGELLAVKQVAISAADAMGNQDASKKKRSDALSRELELLKEVCWMCVFLIYLFCSLIMCILCGTLDLRLTMRRSMFSSSM